MIQRRYREISLGDRYYYKLYTTTFALIAKFAHCSVCVYDFRDQIPVIVF